MTKPYESGTFCRDIQCEHHEALADLSGDEYLKKKAEHCKNCYAWMFFTWLRDKDWRIIITQSSMSSKELVARIKGIDPVSVEDLTEDEILCL